MAYREDKDLEFLDKLKSEDLNVLVHLLTHDEKEKLRTTEGLTKSKEYRSYCPDHHRYWKKIAEEIQRFGANTLATVFRMGKGALYKDIAVDVCRHFLIKLDKADSIEVIEEKIACKVFAKAIEALSLEMLKKLAESINVKLENDNEREKVKELIEKYLKKNRLTAYQINVLLGNVMARYYGSNFSSGFIGWGVSLGVLRLLAGPLGWGWFLLDPVKWLTGPAFRVSVPVVLHIAMLRKKVSQGIQTVAVMGSRFTGKTTLIDYLRTGECNCENGETQEVQYLPVVESPIWKCEVSCADSPGASDAESIKTQKQICNSANVVLFCYNPKDVYEMKIEKDHFLERLELLENKENVFFIATHKNEYDVNAMQKFMLEFFKSPDMGRKSQIYSEEKSFFVDIFEKESVVRMLNKILDKID